MAAVMLSQANRGAITLAPPWSKRMFKLGVLATPKGVIPEALRPFVATGMNPNLAKAQAVVQANTINPPEVRRRNTEKARRYKRRGTAAT